MEHSIVFTQMGVRQTDEPGGGISCTGSGYCAEVCPGIQVDEVTGLCIVVGGEEIETNGAIYRMGELRPGTLGLAIQAALGCDSSAFVLVDSEENIYDEMHGGEVLASAQLEI